MFKNFRISKDLQDLHFELHKVDLSIANALRRTCLVEVPIAGIDRDSISFRSEDNNINSSSFHDEFLSHRIAFSRLKIGTQEVDDYEMSICDKKDHDLPFTNSTDDIVDYTAFDMIVKKNGAVVKSSDVLLYDGIVARLKPNQQLKASMTINARAVRAQDTEPRYHYQPCRVKFCYKNERHADGKMMTPDDELKYIGHNNRTPEGYVFDICGFGSPNQATPDIVTDALTIIRQKVAQLIMNIEASSIDKSADTVLENTMFYRVPFEDHTLGSMAAQKCREFLDVNGKSNKNFVAYQKVHPLEAMLLIKLKIDGEKVNMSHDAVFASAMKLLLKELDALEKNWKIAIKKALK